MIVRTAQDVPELQAEMAAWAHDTTGHGATGYFTTLFTAAGIHRLPTGPAFAGHTVPASVARHLADTLDLAEAFYVTADMTALAHHAARSLTDYTFTVEDLPAPAGLLVFQDPPDDSDRNGVRRPVHAITWGPQRGTTAVDYWTRHYTAMYPVPHTDTRPRPHPTRPEHRLHPVHTPHHHDFALSAALHPGSPVDAAFGDHNAHTLRLLAATWLLMGQTIATHTTRDIPRAARRRIARLTPRTPARVRVIELRHARTSGDGAEENTPGTRAYQHRWVVRGHWRRYRAPRFSDEVRARPIWIGDHIAGPPTAPLIGGQRVHVLKR
ncbi:hypothetical protein OG948_58650 (plasmid) [Embleya sp. NBC_00888]|uniref:hypothetical protein n=1 Tax=Embleya sp. NBC_00888 TaxID=2975960 RepID=UPI002F9196F9|nr:hypothetical protein OG948_58650 [Embleya sp. NBC_00888]